MQPLNFYDECIINKRSIMKRQRIDESTPSFSSYSSSSSVTNQDTDLQFTEIKKYQSQIGASSISPGAFAMLMGVHVRFRTEEDPPFDSPKFLSEPLTGACKPESLMIIEFDCLMHGKMYAYNEKLKEIYETKVSSVNIEANIWKTYPKEYSKDVKERYNRILGEYKKCHSFITEIPGISGIPDTENSYASIHAVFEIQKYLDLYPYLPPGLFLTMLGIHAKYPATVDEAAYEVSTNSVFTGNCKSVKVMATEFVYLLAIAHKLPKDLLRIYITDEDDILKKVTDHRDSQIIIENMERYNTETLENSMIPFSLDMIYDYAINLENFLKRLKYEYRECRPKQSQKQQQTKTIKDPTMFHNKIFVCDEYANAKINKFVEDGIIPADIQKLCDSTICEEDKDEITYEVLRPDAVKLFAGGVIHCYNRDTVETFTKQIPSKEPFSKIPFSKSQRLYLQDYTSNAFRYYILRTMRNSVRKHAEKYGIHVKDIRVFFPRKLVDTELDNTTLYELRKSNSQQKEEQFQYIIQRVIPKLKPSFTQTRALLKAYVEKTDPRNFEYQLQPGDRGYGPPLAESNMTIESNYRHTLDSDELLNRLVEVLSYGLKQHMEMYGHLPNKPTPEQETIFRDIFKELGDILGYSLLQDLSTKQLIEIYVNNMMFLNNPVTAQVEGLLLSYLHSD